MVVSKTFGKYLLRGTIYGGLIFLGLHVNDFQPKKSESLNDQNHEKLGYIKIKDRYIKYDVYEKGEVKTIADMLSSGCQDDLCEVEKDLDYVTALPYKQSKSEKTPSSVINTNGGDCDEKSFLLASLLLEHSHLCVLIVTHDHAFIAVHIKDDSAIQHPSAYLTIEGKKYYYAETTIQGKYVGWFNKIGKDAFEGVYDINRKKLVPLDEIGFHWG